VQISSERLGISGKLDLVEEKNGLVYPVEYKRGAGPGGDNGQPLYWENDAIQFCAQEELLARLFMPRSTRKPQSAETESFDNSLQVTCH
jgi:hypothetical protein